MPFLQFRIMNFSQNRERVIITVLIGVVLMLVIFFSSLILQTFREYKNFKAQESRIEEKLIQARKELEYKEMYLSLLDDPDFLERVARERLGYARPDELLFRFSDEL